jgi:hypothetical protein
METKDGCNYPKVFCVMSPGLDAGEDDAQGAKRRGAFHEKFPF